MSSHYVVIESVSGQSTECAVLDVSSQTAGNVTFQIRNAAGTQVGYFALTLNADRYACSAQNTPNLFSLTNYQNGSVTITAPGDAMVTLRHTVGSTIARALSVPRGTIARATTIAFPTGGLGIAAHALVFNLSTSSKDVTLRYGTAASPLVSTTPIPANGVGLIPIGNNDANAVLGSPTELIAQYRVKLSADVILESYALP